MPVKVDFTKPRWMQPVVGFQLTEEEKACLKHENKRLHGQQAVQAFLKLNQDISEIFLRLELKLQQEQAQRHADMASDKQEAFRIFTELCLLLESIQATIKEIEFLQQQLRDEAVFALSRMRQTCKPAGYLLQDLDKDTQNDFDRRFIAKLVKRKLKARREESAHNSENVAYIHGEMPVGKNRLVLNRYKAKRSILEKLAEKFKVNERYDSLTAAEKAEMEAQYEAAAAPYCDDECVLEEQRLEFIALDAKVRPQMEAMRDKWGFEPVSPRNPAPKCQPKKTTI